MFGIFAKKMFEVLSIHDVVSIAKFFELEEGIIIIFFF